MTEHDVPAPDPAGPDFAAHNVLAVLPDMEAARAAITDLERAGIEGNAISLLGRAADEATEPDTDRREGTATDRAVVGDVASGAGKGAAAGAGVGGVAGLIGGAAVFGIPGIGPALAAGIWASVLGGAAAGAGVGFTAGGIASVRQSEAWTLTYEAVDDRKVVLGVHSRDAEVIEQATEVLRGHEPERVEQFDVDGARRL